MPHRKINRIPEVKSLYDLLPKGAEGGKEFARILDLLLFHEGRRTGRKTTVFSDAAGDYHGLDSFVGDAFRKEGTTGYQYKFYPSPLSPAHRKEVVESLVRTAQNQKQLKLKKWVLVTPQDFTESATRKDKGDVSWFEGLRSDLGLKFDLEHLGHKQIISLFLETPAICLFYYPELVPQGATRRRTIQDTRRRYDENIIKQYSDIQFVGMSVYKPEATKGVPMEHIYIPLTVMPEASDEQNANVTRTNPLTFLTPGSRRVILGDPGSGKSTLLRFLALAGISQPLQQRYNAEPDERLPIFITLRRYADELKSRANLPLIDYIQEVVQGDFSLKSADLDFFEYYLESGQAVLFFDGLDELPSPHFKQIVRDRIRTLVTTYPGNTTIVTSRIVGYENPFRFDEKEFGHYRLTRLQLPEIKQFVEDWYRVRIENEREREANVQDLIRIMQDEDHAAIRELAENPLLLTIVALVHRIDAVLPDERVVLYKKCTETLLNTWHTWKFRDSEPKNRGKVERRNRQRMEAIAHWMHCRSGGTGKNQRAVVPYKDLSTFLTKHIAEVEKTTDPDNDAEDLANEFLEFVKKRAGLLIELGDNQYSFVHLTFQEYLTASHIKTNSELGGAAKIWETIKEFCHDARWHEVIRLLIAGLESNESQQFLIEKILVESANGRQAAKAQLLGGLLLDGVEAAEVHKEDVLRELLHAGSIADDAEQLRPTHSMLRSWLGKETSNEEVMSRVFELLWGNVNAEQERMGLLLVAVAIGLPKGKISEWQETYSANGEHYAELFRLFFSRELKKEELFALHKQIKSLWIAEDTLSLDSPPGCLVSTVYECLTSRLDARIAARRTFEKLLVHLSYVDMGGPFFYAVLYGTQIYLDQKFVVRSMRRSPVRTQLNPRITPTLSSALIQARATDLKKALRQPPESKSLQQPVEINALWSSAKRRVGERVVELKLATALRRISQLIDPRMRELVDQLARTRNEELWQSLLLIPSLQNLILDGLCDTLDLKPNTQWWEALRVDFLPNVPQSVLTYTESEWKRVERAFAEGTAGETEVYNAAWQLIFDAWLYLAEFDQSQNESIFSSLVELTRNNDEPPLRIAHCLRDLAYGDESRIGDLVTMVNSDDPAYREIFETCYWRDPSGTKPIPKRSKKQATKKRVRRSTKKK
ncbi:MAG TPA: NACHT domain-containing protein [Pyrinomonadaceae bacterium]|jgi:hypothetical protein